MRRQAVYFVARVRHTKIVATIGPASRDPKVLQLLVQAGIDVVRLNFSHGEHADHLAVLTAVREIAAAAGRSVAVLQDLSGPKIRTGKVKGGEVLLQDGATLTITTDETVEGTAQLISTTYDPLPADVAPGDRILLDDGNLELKVVRASGQQVECVVVHGGPLRSNKGMNLPGVTLSTPALTEKDKRDLAFGIEHRVDYVALSFVRQAADVDQAKELIRSLGGTSPLIAKIEKREAMDDLPAILQAADGIMVARGDLGVEMSTEEVPTLQKRIIELSNAAGRAVITATQMLESMIEHSRPTRAEASDVANAILDGTDAVMLSAETASGRFPVQTVETMARIAHYTEEQYSRVPARFRSASRATDAASAAVKVAPGSQVARSLARVASTVCEELGCKLIVAFTESGSTARLVSSYRPRAAVAAITPNADTYRRLPLWWGVVPLRSEFSATTDEMIVKGDALLKQRGLAASGEKVVMLAGQSHTTGATNMLRVHTVS
jgi:pyruvate kinase